jgi:gamma-glutamyl:cysteine ligase YbdK (ATP-grasp superfamily)
VLENYWRAQRYGIHGSFVDEATHSARPVAAILDETLAMVAEDSAAMGCEASLAVTRDILARGTSADRQLALFTDATGRGARRATRSVRWSTGSAPKRREGPWRGISDVGCRLAFAIVSPCHPRPELA